MLSTGASCHTMIPYSILLICVPIGLYFISRTLRKRFGISIGINKKAIEGRRKRAQSGHKSKKSIEQDNDVSGERKEPRDIGPRTAISLSSNSQGKLPQQLVEKSPKEIIKGQSTDIIQYFTPKAQPPNNRNNAARKPKKAANSANQVNNAERILKAQQERPKGLAALVEEVKKLARLANKVPSAHEERVRERERHSKTKSSVVVVKKLIEERDRESNKPKSSAVVVKEVKRLSVVCEEMVRKSDKPRSSAVQVKEVKKLAVVCEERLRESKKQSLEDTKKIVTPPKSKHQMPEAVAEESVEPDQIQSQLSGDQTPPEGCAEDTSQGAELQGITAGPETAEQNDSSEQEKALSQEKSADKSQVITEQEKSVKSDTEEIERNTDLELVEDATVEVQDNVISKGEDNFLQENIVTSESQQSIPSSHETSDPEAEGNFGAITDDAHQNNSSGQPQAETAVENAEQANQKEALNEPSDQLQSDSESSSRHTSYVTAEENPCEQQLQDEPAATSAEDTTKNPAMPSVETYTTEAEAADAPFSSIQYHRLPLRKEENIEDDTFSSGSSNQLPIGHKPSALYTNTSTNYNQLAVGHYDTANINHTPNPMMWPQTLPLQHPDTPIPNSYDPQSAQMTDPAAASTGAGQDGEQFIMWGGPMEGMIQQPPPPPPSQAEAAGNPGNDPYYHQNYYTLFVPTPYYTYTVYPPK